MPPTRVHEHLPDARTSAPYGVTLRRSPAWQGIQTREPVIPLRLQKREGTPWGVKGIFTEEVSWAGLGRMNVTSDGLPGRDALRGLTKGKAETEGAAWGGGEGWAMGSDWMIGQEGGGQLKGVLREQTIDGLNSLVRG